MQMKHSLPLFIVLACPRLPMSQTPAKMAPRQTAALSCCSFLLADVSSGISKLIFPFDWTSAPPGSPPGTFLYSTSLTTSVSLSLHVNGWLAGQPATITLANPPTANTSSSVPISVNSTAGALSQFSFLHLPAGRQVGHLVGLQINSNATNFTALHANSTGWRVQMLRPDNLVFDLGPMLDGTVLPGPTALVYQWILNTTGGNVTQVRYVHMHLRL
jgi:hypothetical protein